jgi:hypothetical protein
MSANSARTASSAARATQDAPPSARSVMSNPAHDPAKPVPAVMPSASAAKLIAKHNEFDKVASMMIGAQRSIETTPRGIEQIVVTAPGSILRWPTSYARGEAP